MHGQVLVFAVSFAASPAFAVWGGANLNLHNVVTFDDNVVT